MRLWRWQKLVARVIGPPNRLPREPPWRKPQMSINRRSFIATALAAGASLPASRAFAQAYPARPIHLIVPYPPGGGTDFFARVVSPAKGQPLGQQIIVEHRPGAGTLIG